MLNFNENICRYIIVHFINFAKALHIFFMSPILSIKFFYQQLQQFNMTGFFLSF